LPAKRLLPEIGDPKRRIDLAQTRDRLVRLIQPPGKGMAGRSHARCASGIWLLPESLLRPRRRLAADNNGGKPIFKKWAPYDREETIPAPSPMRETDPAAPLAAPDPENTPRPSGESVLHSQVAAGMSLRDLGEDARAVGGRMDY